MYLTKTHQLIRTEIDQANPAASLLLILESAIELVELPDNDFSWSSWNDADEAKSELAGLIHQLMNGTIPDHLRVAVIFAPTGPLQEVSLSSGWAEMFARVAEKVDQVEKLLWDPAGSSSH
jgi:hypothetical protein